MDDVVFEAVAGFGLHIFRGIAPSLIVIGFFVFFRIVGGVIGLDENKALGVVLLLDGRVLRKRYGRRFLRSLPVGVRGEEAPLQTILGGMRDFLDSAAEPT